MYAKNKLYTKTVSLIFTLQNVNNTKRANKTIQIP